LQQFYRLLYSFAILIPNPETGAFDATFNARQLIGATQSNKIAANSLGKWQH
jgi:hypothetical protein